MLPRNGRHHTDSDCPLLHHSQNFEAAGELSRQQAHHLVETTKPAMLSRQDRDMDDRFGNTVKDCLASWHNFGRCCVQHWAKSLCDAILPMCSQSRNLNSSELQDQMTHVRHAEEVENEGKSSFDLLQSRWPEMQLAL